ncbi:MAG: hypothetical protein GF409_01945 [Candidatus Omnitrophica bacterium]|nr:hypothetical protein [Candidatus Omnitrophota bacterium]
MKRGLIFCLVVAVLCAYSLPVMAQDKADDPVEYTGNVVTGSVNTVGKATQGTAETAVSPIVAFWNAITGKDKPEKIVTDPVNKGGKTIHDATVNTGKTVTGRKQ